MSNKYEPLFAEGKIGKLELKNKLVMAPMGTGRAESDGRITEEQIDYYMERAKGGVGMVIVEGQFVYHEDVTNDNVLYLDHERCVPRLYELTESVHAYGAKICAQMSAGLGRNAPPRSDGLLPVSSSANPYFYNPGIICKELTIDEIQQIVAAFTAAADRVKRAGFDAIEVHAHAGYLIDQFMSSIWNHRTDEYGGSLENRMRFPIEIVKAIRKGTDPNFPVIFRMAAEHKLPNGRVMEDGIAMAKILEEAGVNALDIDAGCYETIDWIFPPSYLGDACMTCTAAEIKKHVTIPVLNTGNYTPDTAVEAITSGSTDFAILGRSLIADPQWPNKLMANKPAEIRPCVRCNENCIGGLLVNRSLSCAINVQAAREKRFAYSKTQNSKKIAIIGGGPAGLEAARVSADKGHAVTLFEKSDHLGGALAAAATPSFKTLRKLLDWYGVQLQNLGVNVKLNTEVNAKSPELEGFDHLIIAVGSKPLVLPIPGIDGDNVIGVIDAHLTPELVKGERVIVAGGGMSGVDSALELAMGGKQVTIIEMLPAVARDAVFVNMPTIFYYLNKYNITIKTEHKIARITDKGVIATNKDGEEVFIEGDTVITAFGLIPNNDIAKTFQSIYPNARLIGDCTRIGKCGDAVHNGFFAGFSLDSQSC